MDEMEIATKLEEFLGIPGLQIQVVWQEEDLVVVFNRPDINHLEYTQLTKRVIKVLQDLKVPPPQQVVFYSRVLGEEEPDWDKIVKVKKAGVPKPKAAEEELTVVQAEEVITTKKPKPQEKVNPTPVTVEPKEPDPIISAPPKLSDFCFTRNKALVKAELPAPAKKVAENVKFFHELSEKVQLELAPVLEDFFKNPDKTSLVSVPPELRSWFEDLKKLKDDEFRSQSIWLSRYCYDSEKTMGEVNALLERLAEQEQQKHKTPEPLPEPVVATTNKRSGSKVSRVSQSSNQVVSKGSQRFTPDELVYMILGSLLIAAIGWFLWGTAAALSVFGWVAAIASVASGVGMIIGNQSLRGFASTVLFIIWLIFFFMGIGIVILWIEFLGWLIGVIAGGAVTAMMQSSGAESVTAPKPLRLLIVYGIVILIGMSYAAITSSSRTEVTFGGDTKPLDTVEVIVTDSSISMSKTDIKTFFAMKVQNQASKDCDIDISPQSGGVSYLINPTSIVKSKKTETLNIRLSNGGVFRLDCEGLSSEPNLLSLRGPTFTAKDE